MVARLVKGEKHTEAVPENSDIADKPRYFAKPFHGLVLSITDSRLPQVVPRLTDLVSMSVVVILPTEITKMAMA
jgi:hypothetical protein